MYPSTFFATNRNNLAKQLPKNSLCVLKSNIQYPERGSQYFPFRQDVNYFYFTGITEPGGYFFLYKDGSGLVTEILLIEAPDPKKEVWDGPMLSTKGAEAISGIVQVEHLAKFDEVLNGLLSSVNTLFVDIEEKEQKFFDYKQSFFLQIQALVGKVEIRNIQPIIANLRLIKSPEEISSLKKAIAITLETFVEMAALIKPGVNEGMLSAFMECQLKSKGAMGHAFHPIVAGGANACTLHYIKNTDQLKKGSLCLLDFGAEYHYLNADCSRTLPVDTKFSARHKEMYLKILDVFYKARKLIRPGNTIKKINDEVDQLCQNAHLELGLYTAVDIQKDPKLTKRYYPHGNSHFLGLDVHDVGDKSTTLEPGMVLTCEPGLYVPSEETGIRIENDILVTEDGNEDLMEQFPITVEEIEQLLKN